MDKEIQVQDKEAYSYRDLKDQKQYLKLIGANVVNRLGDSLDAIAFSWIIYEITSSASLMALIIAINYIPTIILQPIAGVIVDSIPKKRVMVLTDIGRGVIVALVALLYMNDSVTPLILALCTFLNSTLEAFRIPAGLAIVPKLLDRDKYTIGSALNSTLSRICEIIGLASAGAVIALIGSHGALLIDAGTFFISSIIITTIRADEQPKQKKIGTVSIFHQFTDGLRFVKANPLLVAMLLLGMFMNFGMVPMSALGTAYIVDDLKGGPGVLSAFQVALVSGMALGSFVTPKLRTISKKRLFIFCGFASSVLMSQFILLPLINTMILRIIAFVGVMGITGIFVGIQNVVFSAAFMRHVDQSVLGRVGGITNATLSAAMPLGALLCSAAAATMAVPTVFLVAGIFLVFLYIIMGSVKSLDAL